MVTKMSKISAKKLHAVSKMSYEQAAWQRNQVVCGVDEVGRGCLAGPVVAAAVIFPVGAVIPNVRDSKLILPKELHELAQKIHQTAWSGIGIINPYLIDNCNIYQATKLAMCRAVKNLFSICPFKPSQVLVDAMSVDQYLGHDLDCIAAPKGESWSYSIAAASIIAKVKRDQLMQNYHQAFPGFAFNKHKGYGTKEHYAGLQAQGRSILHRASFLKKLDISYGKEGQCSLF